MYRYMNLEVENLPREKRSEIGVGWREPEGGCGGKPPTKRQGRKISTKLELLRTMMFVWFCVWMVLMSVI